MKFTISIILIGAFILSCQNNKDIGNSETYIKEETNAYNQLIDAILDTTGFEFNDTTTQVFYLIDTLEENDNTADANPWSDNYLDIKLTERLISIKELNKNSKHRYVRATDSLKIQKHEHFTRYWLTFSRICFNKDRTNGFLDVKAWCGNLCSQSDRYEIESIEGTWKIKKRYRGPVS
jgi:hypothetical protein